MKTSLAGAILIFTEQITCVEIKGEPGAIVLFQK